MEETKDTGSTPVSPEIRQQAREWIVNRLTTLQSAYRHFDRKASYTIRQAEIDAAFPDPITRSTAYRMLDGFPGLGTSLDVNNQRTYHIIDGLHEDYKKSGGQEFPFDLQLELWQKAVKAGTEPGDSFTGHLQNNVGTIIEIRGAQRRRSPRR